MIWTPESVQIGSLSSPTFNENPASSNGFCIWPRPNGPRSPPRFAELQSLYFDASSSNVFSFATICRRNSVREIIINCVNHFFVWIYKKKWYKQSTYKENIPDSAYYYLYCQEHTKYGTFIFSNNYNHLTEGLKYQIVNIITNLQQIWHTRIFANWAWECPYTGADKGGRVSTH